MSFISKLSLWSLLTAAVLSACVHSFTTTKPAHRLSSHSRLHPASASSLSAATSSFPSNKDLGIESSSSNLPSETDVIVIGSGLAGLSCAALLAHNQKRVVVLESHDSVGGCAHGWHRRGFSFESGPSLYSGLSTTEGSPNPLKNIFQIVGEDCEWITYDRWGTVMPNGSKFAAKIGPGPEFEEVLETQGGPEAPVEFQRIMDRIRPLSDAAQALTSLALREDPWVIITLLKYPKEIFQTLQQGPALQEPFSTIVDELELKNEFVRNWLDMLCFLLQGLPSSDTPNSVISYMMADWYRPGVTLDFPKGGSSSMAHALVRAVTRQRDNSCGSVHVNCHVDQVLVENGRACGVRLSDGTICRATQAVVSNADPYITRKLLQPAMSKDADSLSKIQEYLDDMVNTDPATGGIADLKSFIHIHAGIDATGLPTEASADFPAQWAVIRDWGVGVEAPRNIVLCSMPSLIDDSLAPDGNHVLHAYVPATEPYAEWAQYKDDRTNPDYLRKKEEAADFLWSAIEEYVPNARDRAVPGTVQIGTPVTHERFLRRTRGTYGPRVQVGKGQSLPGHVTPLPGLLMVGDFTFPGIGVPATAASGAIAANSLVSVWEHLSMLNNVKLPGN